MNYYISHGSDADLENENLQVGLEETWTVNPNAQENDRILIYLLAPHSAIAAMATVIGRQALDGARHGWDGHVLKRVRIDKVFTPPLPLATLKKRLPKWGWPRMPKAAAKVPESQLPKLLKLLDEPRYSRPAEAGSEKEGVQQVGGGFGDSEMNRKVELAAVRLVRKHYELKGWAITDRQKDSCGYDLLATRNRAKLYLEVKGAKGAEPGFIISANEVRCSKKDREFRLCLVTNALGGAPSLKVMTRQQMEKAFKLSPLTYIAKPKR